MSLKKFLSNTLCICLVLGLCFSVVGCSSKKKGSEPQEEPTVTEEVQGDPDAVAETEQTTPTEQSKPTEQSTPTEQSKPTAQQSKPTTQQPKPTTQQPKPTEQSKPAQSTSVTVGSFKIEDPSGVKYDTRSVYSGPTYKYDSSYDKGGKTSSVVIYTLGGKLTGMFMLTEFDTAEHATAYVSDGRSGTVSGKFVYIVISGDDNIAAFYKTFPDLNNYINILINSGYKKIS